LLLSAAVTVVVPLSLGLAPIPDDEPAPQRVAHPPASLVLISIADPAPLPALPPIPLPPPPPDPRDPAAYADPIDGNVISAFGRRDGRRHEGLDIKGGHRAPISASFSGRVVQAGQGGTGYGLSVTVAHGDGVTTLYAHLSSVSVRVGDEVTAGQQVGLQGQTGRATTAHLHYEVRIGGRPVDPMPYLAD